MNTATLLESVLELYFYSLFIGRSHDVAVTICLRYVENAISNQYALYPIKFAFLLWIGENTAQEFKEYNVELNYASQNRIVWDNTYI